MVIKSSEFTRMSGFMIYHLKAPLVALLGRSLNPMGFIDKIRMVYGLLKLIKAIDKFPDPTKENTVFRNVKVLIDIEQQFIKYYKLPTRMKALLALIKWGIICCDHDSHYASIADWWIEQIMRRGWERRPAQHPSPDYWNEPEPYGGFHPLSDEIEGISLTNERLLNDVCNYKESFGNDTDKTPS